MNTGPEYHVFISYCRKDLLWRDRILKCLREMATYRDTRVFVDQDIPPGADWKARLSEVLGQARVALLLVSRAWMESPECQEELRQCLALRALGTHRVVWMPLDGSTQDTLAKLQTVGDAATALSLLRDDRLITAGIDEICREVLNQVDPLWDQLQSRLPRKYRLVRRLGEGSTSAVYLAADLSLGRRVGVRAVRDPVDNLEFDAAVHRAVKVGRHPAILAVFGAWLEGDPHCCVVDYLEGRSLRSHLESPTLRWDARDVVRLLLRIGEALVETHARDIHLRDLRPSKILIDDNGNAFMCGLSKPDNAVGQPLLQRAKSAGRKLTPEQARYFVPEHFYPLGGSESDEQSDQYLLGLVAYEILTRALPPTLANPDAVLAGETPRFASLRPLRELRATVPGCPLGLSDAISKMTSINPGGRFARLADVLDVIRALQPVDLVLARESYARCARPPDREKQFFDSFYATFRAACPEAGAQFNGFTPNRWRRLHGLLKEAVLLLFAYAATPASARGEPNVLSRIGAMHGDDGKLNVAAPWYDDFAKAMIQTACELDPECEDSRARPFIEQAWQSSLEPGTRYMKTYCQRSSTRAAAASKTRVARKRASGREGGAHGGG